MTTESQNAESSPLSQAAATEPRVEPMTLEQALAALDPENDDHWNKDGSPKVHVVESMVGDKSITKADIEAAAPGLNRQMFVRVAPQPENPVPPAPVAVARNGVADLNARVAKLEDDIAFLRGVMGWPTK